MAKIVIIVQGGLVQEVITSEKSEYLILDQDDTEAPTEFREPDGTLFTAGIINLDTEYNPDLVEHYRNQVPAM